MCIQFVYLNNNAAEDGYRLVVVNNRDEYYNRPTKPASFWGSGNLCLSGLDQFPGREGGTWFGVSKAGKIGCLLNILAPEGPNPEKQARGHLVADYINRPICAATYLAELEKEASTFNLFNLILIEKTKDTSQWTTYYYSNSPEFENNSVVVLKDGSYGFSNSVFNKPFKKVEAGKAQMERIMSRFGTVGAKHQLQEALFDLMADKTYTLPDPQLLAQGGSKLEGPLLGQRSGIYVDSSQIGYGTRTTTLFTVTAADKAEYTEKTMREPINNSSPVWDRLSCNFKFTSLHSSL